MATCVPGVLNIYVAPTLTLLKQGKPLSEVTGWVRDRMVSAILRATNLCIRGSRVKWRSAVHMEDHPHQLMNRLCMCCYVCACFCSNITGYDGIWQQLVARANAQSIQVHSYPQTPQQENELYTHSSLCVLRACCLLICVL